MLVAELARVQTELQFPEFLRIPLPAILSRAVWLRSVMPQSSMGISIVAMTGRWSESCDGTIRYSPKLHPFGTRIQSITRVGRMDENVISFCVANVFAHRWNWRDASITSIAFLPVALRSAFGRSLGVELKSPAAMMGTSDDLLRSTILCADDTRTSSLRYSRWTAKSRTCCDCES